MIGATNKPGTLHQSADAAFLWRRTWDELSLGARRTLTQLCCNGPTPDDALVSVAGWYELVRKRLAARIVLDMGTDGYTAATTLGAHVWRAGAA